MLIFYFLQVLNYKTTENKNTGISKQAMHSFEFHDNFKNSAALFS